MDIIKKIGEENIKDIPKEEILKFLTKYYVELISKIPSDEEIELLRDFCNKVSESNLVFYNILKDKNSSEYITNIRANALLKWSNQEKTPIDYKEHFRKKNK